MVAVDRLTYIHNSRPSAGEPHDGLVSAASLWAHVCGSAMGSTMEFWKMGVFLTDRWVD